MADTAEATGTTVSDAAAAIEGLLSGEPEDQQPATPPQAGQAEGDAPADTAAQPEQETAPPDQEGENAPEDGDADEEQPAKVAADDAFYTVKIDGKDERVTVKELAQGFLRTRDYTQKTQALAQERRALEPERQAVLQERQQYAQMLPLVVQYLQAQHPPEPNPALMEQDPIEYARQNNLYTAHQRRLQASLAEQQRIGAMQAQQFQQARGQTLAEGRDKLHEAVPEWKDPKKWDADRVALAKYALTMGYSEDEVGQATDHRAILLLRKAKQYDDLMAKKPEPAPQRGPRQLAAGSAQAPNQGLRKIRQHASQTGRVEDAASWIQRSGLV